ncbi:MAG TPA: DnaJ domain-containing protein [Solirubrobacteraceae bacterium]
MTVDPFAVLGVAPDASAEEVAAAYRRLAKRWHPDRAGSDGAARMAEINAAYDLLRAEAWLGRQGRAAPPVAERPPGRRAPAGAWLAEAVRRALGRELLVALEPEEDVALVTPVSTWASPQALLAVTDRRLLWLLDDAPTHRVRSLRFHDVAAVEQRMGRPLRRSAVLRVRTMAGRKLSFADLRPATAAAIAQHMGAVGASR